MSDTDCRQREGWRVVLRQTSSPARTGFPIWGALTATAGFVLTHAALWQNQKNARSRSRFFWAVTGASGQPDRNSRIAVTSSCFRSRYPFPSHHGRRRLTSRFVCFESVVGFRCCPYSKSWRNFWTASLTVGTSALTTPSWPEDSQPRTSSDAASQEVRSRARRNLLPAQRAVHVNGAGAATIPR